MQRQQPALERIVERLQHHGLVVKQELKVRLPGGELRVVRGVNLVDEKRFNALDDDAFHELRRCSTSPRRVIGTRLTAWLSQPMASAGCHGDSASPFRRAGKGPSGTILAIAVGSSQQARGVGVEGVARITGCAVSSRRGCSTGMAWPR
ncbi:SapC family protein [Halomonas sp. H10-9-1]